jgi:DNA-binding FadR family transcriptional regulator
MFDIMKHLGTKMIRRTQMNSAYASNEERLAHLEMVHHEHDSIFASIAMQSPDSARAAMYLHLNNSRERLRRTRIAKVARQLAQRAVRTQRQSPLLLPDAHRPQRTVNRAEHDYAGTLH